MTAWPLWLALAVGGLGLYFRLIAGRAPSHPTLWRTGAVLGGVSLVLLAALAWMTNETWPPPRRMAGGPRIALLILLAVTLYSSGAAVTSRRSAQAVLWLAVALAANAVLWLWLGSHWVGVLALAVAAAGIVLTGWCLVWTVHWDAAVSARYESEHEPWLACVAGVLLAGSLVGAMHDSLAAEPPSAAVERGPARAGERLHHLLITGACLVSLGAVGFSSGRGDHRLAIAGGVALQGIVLTSAAAVSPLGAGGQALSVAALIIVALQASTVLILLLRGDSQPAEERSFATDRTRGLHGRD